MKTLLTILALFIGAASYSQSVKYKPSTHCFTINDSRDAVYKFEWGNGIQTYFIEAPLHQFSFGTPSIICAAEANNNDPNLYLFGRIQDGWTIRVKKNGVVLKEVTVNY